MRTILDSQRHPPPAIRLLRSPSPAPARGGLGSRGAGHGGFGWASLLLIWLVQAPFADAATFSVTSTNDSGAGSLRQAILDANLSPDTDAIVFNISGAGPHAIRPASALPTLTYPVTLNGYTQSGAVSNSLAVGDNAVLKIRLSGISAGAGVNGLQVNVAGCEIRGLSIVNWSGNGIYLLGQSDTRVQGNFIGLDVDGVTVATNSGKGIRSTAANALIGGLDPGQRNIISGNGTGGIELFNSAGNTVQGNYIGTDASGTVGLGNGGSGIYVTNPNSTNNVIGGTNSAARNFIAASTGSGASGNNGLLLKNCLNNFIHGNFIGTDVTGTNALGNAGAGILMTNALHTVVGGLSPGAGNVIAFNGAAGLRIPAGTNEVSGNAIFSNGLLGIDLGTVNVTANDAGDADTGANNLQNFPVLTSATNLAGTITIRGTLNSLPTKSFRIEFFSSASCDGSGSGEGKNYLGTTNVTTDAGNNATFTVAFPAVDAADTVVTATATAPDGGTSEFSACRAIVSSDPAAILSQPVFQSVFLGSNATFSVVASGALPLTYQWLLNGSPIAQATNSTLVVTNVLPQQAGGYGVQVSNSFGFALSQTATLSLQTPPTDLVVGNLNDSGAGSLRYALLNANLDPDLSRINFNLSGPGPFSIALSSPLPTITTRVTIDATTQPGFTNKPIVELDGSGVTGDGLVLTAGASTVRGLVINRFSSSGVRLESGGSNLIAGNFIGTALDGRTDRGNGQHGIVISNSAGNVIADHGFGLAAKRVEPRKKTRLPGLLHRGRLCFRCGGLGSNRHRRGHCWHRNRPGGFRLGYRLGGSNRGRRGPGHGNHGDGNICFDQGWRWIGHGRQGRHHRRRIWLHHHHRWIGFHHDRHFYRAHRRGAGLLSQGGGDRVALDHADGLGGGVQIGDTARANRHQFRL